MIEPEAIPVRELERAIVAIDTGANLGMLGQPFIELGANVHSRFSMGLSEVYHAPEAPLLIRSTERVQTQLGNFGSKLPEMTKELERLREQLLEMLKVLRDMQWQGREFRATIQGRDDWREDKPLVEWNNRLVERVTKIMHEYLPTAAFDTANAIARLYGGKQWDTKTGLREGEQPREKPQGDPPPPAWGTTEEWDKPFLLDAAEFVVDVAIVGPLTVLGETVEGLLTLVPVLPLIGMIPGVREGMKKVFNWDMPTWESVGHAWAGVGLTIGHTITALPELALWGAEEMFGVQRPQWVKDYSKQGVDMLKGMVAWDEWSKNPGKALGMTITNIAATIGTFGAGAAVKSAAMAGKMGMTAAKVAKVVGKLDDLKINVKNSALEGLGKIPGVGKVVNGLEKIPVIGENFKVTTPKVDVDVPGTSSKLPDGHVPEAKTNTNTGHDTGSPTHSDPGTSSPSSPTEVPGHTQQPGGHTEAPSHTQQPGGHTEQPGHTQPGGHTETPGHTQQPGGHTEQPGQTQQPGGPTGQPSHTQQPSGHPEQPGTTQPATTPPGSHTEQPSSPGKHTPSQEQVPAAHHNEQQTGGGGKQHHTESLPEFQKSGTTTPGTHTSETTTTQTPTPQTPTTHTPTPTTHTPTQTPTTQTPTTQTPATQTPGAPGPTHTPEVPAAKAADPVVAPFMPMHPGHMGTPHTPGTGATPGTPGSPATPGTPNTPSAPSRTHQPTTPGQPRSRGDYSKQQSPGQRLDEATEFAPSGKSPGQRLDEATEFAPPGDPKRSGHREGVDGETAPAARHTAGEQQPTRQPDGRQSSAGESDGRQSSTREPDEQHPSTREPDGQQPPARQSEAGQPRDPDQPGIGDRLHTEFPEQPNRRTIGEVLDGKPPTISERLDGPRPKQPDRAGISEVLDGEAPPAARHTGDRPSGDRTPGEQPHTRQPEAGQPHARQSEAGQPHARQSEAGQPHARQPDGQQAGQPRHDYSDDPTRPPWHHPDYDPTRPDGGVPPTRHPDGPQTRQPDGQQPHLRQPETGQPHHRQPHTRQPDGQQPHLGQPRIGQSHPRQPESQQPHVGQPDGPSSRQPDGGNDPRYDEPIERELVIEELKPEYAKAEAGKSRWVVDRFQHIIPDHRDPGWGDLVDSVGDAPVRNVNNWAHKVNPDNGFSPAFGMNCPEVSRAVADIFLGDPPRLAAGNKFRKGETPAQILEWMGLRNFKPENLFLRPPAPKKGLFDRFRKEQADDPFENAAYQRVRDALAGKPAGTHAYILVKWRGGTAHAFNAFVDVDGKMKWLDAQPTAAVRNLDPKSPEFAEGMKHIVKDGDGPAYTNPIDALGFAIREPRSKLNPNPKWDGVPAVEGAPPASVRSHLEQTRHGGSGPDGSGQPGTREFVPGRSSDDILGTSFPDEPASPPVPEAGQPSLSERLGGERSAPPPVRPETPAPQQPVARGWDALTEVHEPTRTPSQPTPEAGQPSLSERLGGGEPESPAAQAESPAPQQPSQPAGRALDDLTEVQQPQRPQTPQQPGNARNLGDILDGGTTSRPPASPTPPRHPEQPPATHTQQPSAPHTATEQSPAGRTEQPAPRHSEQQPAAHAEQPAPEQSAPRHSEQVRETRAQESVFQQEPSPGMQRISGNLNDRVDHPPVRQPEQPAARMEPPAARQPEQPAARQPEPRSVESPVARADGNWRMTGDLDDGIRRSEWRTPETPATHTQSRAPEQPGRTPEQPGQHRSESTQPGSEPEAVQAKPESPAQEWSQQPSGPRPSEVGRPSNADEFLKSVAEEPPSGTRSPEDGESSSADDPLKGAGEESPAGSQSPEAARPSNADEFLQKFAEETPPDIADRNFRVTDAEQAQLAARWSEYDPKRLALHRERGREQLGDVVDELTDVDIIAMEHLLKMDHDWINTGLRSGDATVENDLIVRSAVSALNKLPDMQGGAHRGVRPSTPEKLEKLLERYEVGKAANEKAFTHSDKRDDAAHSGNVQLHISSRHGKDLTFLRDPHTGIQEVVHLPNTDFFPMHRQFDEETGTWHIYVRDHSGPYVPDDEPGGMS